MVILSPKWSEIITCLSDWKSFVPVCPYVATHLEKHSSCAPPERCVGCGCIREINEFIHNFINFRFQIRFSILLRISPIFGLFDNLAL